MKRNFLLGSLPPRLTHGFETEGSGEWRSMQNIAAILLKYDQNVFTGNSLWLDQEKSLSSNFHNSLPLVTNELIYIDWWAGQNLKDVDNTILIAFDCNQKREIKELSDWVFPFYKHPYIVSLYPCGFRYEQWKRIAPEQINFLPHAPLLDTPSFEDSFGKKNIFWTTKGGLKGGSQTELLTEELVKWISLKLLEDNALTFSMVSYGRLGDEETVTQECQNSILYQKYLQQFGDRVKLLGRLSFRDFKRELSKSKIIVNQGIFCNTFAGSPIEAAFFGIPSVQYYDGPFHDMSGVIEVKDSNSIESHIQKLNMLFHNELFYKESALRYYTYASNVYSTDNFMTQLELILNKMEQRK